MSRRKQLKPQHVNFDNSTNAVLTSEALSNSTGEIGQILRHDLLDAETPCLKNTEQTRELLNNSSCLTQYRDTERTSTNSKSISDLSTYTLNCSDDQKINLNLNSGDEEEILETEMEPSPALLMDEGRQYAFESAGTRALNSGETVPPPHSQLYPKFSANLPVTQRRQEEGSFIMDQNNISVEDMDIIEEKETKDQDSSPSCTPGETRDHTDPEPPPDQEAEMYACARCGENFSLLGDFVQHKKSDCSAPSPVLDRAEGDIDIRSEEHDYHDGDSKGVTSPKNYVINSDVIMTDPNAHYNELPVTKRDCDQTFEGHDGDTRDAEPETEMERSTGSLMLESLNSTRVAVSQTMTGMEENDLDSESRNEQYPASSHSSPAPEERPPTPEEEEEIEKSSNRESPPMDQYEDRERGMQADEKDDTEKLQKEILATEAMAHTIQSMTSFASQPNGILGGESHEKPEISAIKNQVRMIQQQQAYQIQMLNFLQWQLALASSKPQAAMAAAAAAASARSAAMPNPLGMNPPIPPQLLPGNLGGTGLMPQMMAAMAMNNLQNVTSGEMSDLAKARLMMTMQQNATENAPNFRSLFSRSFGEQESLMRGEQEQRYQLKDRSMEEGGEVEKEKKENREQEKERECPTSPASGRSEKCDQVSKSDSGYDEDGKTGLHGNGVNYADDTSSSHGSQEDGELRDGVLKATGEEHRHRCRFCHKIFGSDSALQIHIRSHTGERPFKCNICGNRFTTKGNLKVHFMRHKSKYPHIPMNSHPVPEYLDHVPTSTGVPYGMSILPEKAVLERPRLHGNPSIHINPQQAAALSQRDSAPHGLPNLFMPHLNSGNNDHMTRPDLPNGMAPNDMASVIQAQLLQRRREEYMASQWNNEEPKTSPRTRDASEAGENKNPMSMLQAAMLPFLPSLAARQQLENLPPHLRYLLPHHLQALQAQNAMNDKNENNNNLAAHMLSGSQDLSNRQKAEEDQEKEDLQKSDKMVAPVLPTRPTMMTPSSETSKLQRLVENIDRGRILQKNECHICHRVLSCQSALKLHYRTHTGERPYKCDLCSRAFTTRGNLRTHYSSVHRQQMRPIPPGGSHASRTSPPGAFPCPLCPARFRDAVEFQHHMQMHAMVQAQQQHQRLALEQEKQMTSPPSSVMNLSGKMENFDQERGKDFQAQSDRAEGRESESSDDHRKEESFDREIKSENVEPEGKVLEAEKPNDVYDDVADDVRSASAYSQGENASSERSVTPKEERDHDPEIHDRPLAMDLSSPSHNQSAEGVQKEYSDSHARTSTPPSNPLDSLAALSNLSASSIMPQHTGSMLDHQMAALSRARAGRLTMCEICEKPFSCQSALEIHLRTHTKERPFLCKICQRTFTTKGNLKQHLLTHNITDIPEEMLEPATSPSENNSTSNSPSTTPPPSSHVVPFVQKRPAEASDLSGPPQKRNFPRHWCHICQKQFSSASSLQIHNRTHTGEKPFACSVCGRAFTTKGNLKVHMGTHVWGAGGSRRGRRISMDNPLISPWMKNMRPRAAQPGMVLPTSGHVTDPAALYQQYAAIASGLLNAKQDAASRLMLPMSNGHPGNLGNSASSPGSSSGSPLPSNEMTSPQNRMNGPAMANNSMTAATEWFLKAYQRTQEQVN